LSPGNPEPGSGVSGGATIEFFAKLSLVGTPIALVVQAVLLIVSAR